MVSFFRKSTRPIIKFPFTNAELILEFITATSLSLMLGMVLFSWSSIPDIVPRHFSITGEIDAWGNKNFLHLPLTPAVIIYILLSVLSRFPHIYNYPFNITAKNAESQYKNARTLLITVKAETVLILNYIQWTIISKTKALFFPAFIFVLLGTILYFIYRAYKLK